MLLKSFHILHTASLFVPSACTSECFTNARSETMIQSRTLVKLHIIHTSSRTFLLFRHQRLWSDISG